MPRFRPFEPDGGTYVLRGDRCLPPDQQVSWHYRDPLPSQLARYESQLGHFDLQGTEVTRGDGETRVRSNPTWVSCSAVVSIRVLLDCLTDVVGPGPGGSPLAWPKRGTEEERERFLGVFVRSDLYEVADHLLRDRAALSEDERGN